MFQDIDLHFTIAESKVRALICQPILTFENWQKDDDTGLFFLSNSQELSEILDFYIETGLRNDVSLIIFPELSLTIEMVQVLQQTSYNNNLVIIAGSQYYRFGFKTISRCPIIINGTIHYTDKITPAPIEKHVLKTKGLTPGQKILVLKNTPIGNFCVLICADYLVDEIREKIPKEDLHFIIVIAFQKESNWYHNRLNSQCESSKRGVYFLYNNLSVPTASDGDSSVFGEMDKLYVDQLKDEGLISGIHSKKMFSISSLHPLGFLVAEFDLDDRKPPGKRNMHTKPNMYVLDYSKGTGETNSFESKIQHVDPRYKHIDKLFVPPTELQDIRNKLESEDLVFITGDPGTGKTYTAVKLLKEYFNNGYNPIWLSGQEYDDRKTQRRIMESIVGNRDIPPNSVVYFEDPFGRTEFEKRDSLYAFLPPFRQYLSTIRCKVIITSRSEIFDLFTKDGLLNHELANLKREINIVSPSYSQTGLVTMLSNYLSLYNVSPSKKLLQFVNQSILKGIICTPFEIRELYMVLQTSPQDTKILQKAIHDSRNHLTRLFALELKSIGEDKLIAYILVFLFGKKNYRFMSHLFTKVLNKRHNTSKAKTPKLREITTGFSGMRIEKYGKTSELMRFSHPLYEDALVFFTLNNEVSKTLFVDIFHTLQEDRRDIAILRSLSRLTHRYPELTLKLLNQINSDLLSANTPAAINLMCKLIGASIMFERNKYSLSRDYKRVILNSRNLDEILNNLNVETNIYTIRSLIKLMRKYLILFPEFDTNEIVDQIDTHRLAIILRTSQKNHGIIEFLREIKLFDQGLFKTLTEGLYISRILRIIGLSKHPQRKEILHLLTDHSRFEDINSFTKAINTLQDWAPIAQTIFSFSNVVAQVQIDHGAAKALYMGLNNLLPVGITKTIGTFDRGELVKIIDTNNKIIGSGFCEYSSAELSQIQGLHSSKISTTLGYSYGNIAIRRNNLFIEKN